MSQSYDDLKALISQRDALFQRCEKLEEALNSALKIAEFENHPWRPWHDQARAAIAKATGET